MANEILIPEESIQSKIYLIRGQKVMLDRDLAELYDVETKYLKRQVRRNIERFPEDFMFEITKEEYASLRSQFGTLKQGEHSKYLPLVFTEQGVAQLSSVINSKRAIAVNIQIIRLFTKMREMLLNHKELLQELENIKQKIGANSNDIELIFTYLKQLEKAKQEELEQKLRRQIGYKTKSK